MTPDIRRIVLKPLKRRKVAPARSERIEVAFQILEERAIATAFLPELVAATKQAQKAIPNGAWMDHDYAKARIELTAAIYLARGMSFHEYIFVVASAAETVHEDRISAGSYPELKRLFDEMHAVKLAHGLKSDQFWLIADAPPEYRALDVQWSKASEVRLAETLRDLEGQAASSLFDSDRSEFYRLRERGRRSFFHKDEPVAALADTIIRYEHEARAAALANAFTAAVVLLGAAVEGLLLLRCLHSPKKASRVATSLPREKRPKDVTAHSKWTFDTLIHVCLEAGWLPVIDTASMTVRPDELAHLLRQMRNYVHPGKVSSDHPWIEVDGRDFADAETVYTALFATMHKGRMLKAFVHRDADAV